MWYECECALDLVLDTFLTNFGINLGSQNCSKNSPTINCFGPIFRTLFYEVLKLFKCLLGAFLSLWCSSWEASGPQKPLKNILFLRFLQMQLFGSLKLWMALLDPSWLLLGPIWSQNGPEHDPKKMPKSCPKNGPKNCPQKVEFPNDCGLQFETILDSNSP